MSRIHSSRKGRAGSHRPYPATNPTWVSLSSEEIVEQAVQLSKTGIPAAQVGQKLRDSYGVPSVRAATGQRLTDVLRAHGIQNELPEDLQALLKRVVHLQRHLQSHPKDLANQRGLSLIESRIRRLARYYRHRKALPDTWRYSAAAAALQVE